jgi:hypothetical protein
VWIKILEGNWATEEYCKAIIRWLVKPDLLREDLLVVASEAIFVVGRNQACPITRLSRVASTVSTEMACA